MRLTNLRCYVVVPMIGIVFLLWGMIGCGGGDSATTATPDSSSVEVDVDLGQPEGETGTTDDAGDEEATPPTTGDEGAPAP